MRLRVPQSWSARFEERTNSLPLLQGETQTSTVHPAAYSIYRLSDIQNTLHKVGYDIQIEGMLLYN